MNKNIYLKRVSIDTPVGNRILPILGSVVNVALSLVALYLPKMILDCVTAQVTIQLLVEKLVLAGSLWLLLTVGNLALQNAITSHAQTQLYTRWIPAWEEKTMELDYEVFSSHQGKVLMEKARQVVSGPNWGMVTYLPRATALLSAVGGLLAYSAILSTLHPLVVLALLALLGLELWQSIRTERKKQALKQEKAEAGRKLNYIAYGTRGLVEGKDIRIYNMAGWLREMARRALGQKRRLERITAGYEQRRMVFSGALILVRDSCAYGFLLYAFFRRDMSVGDFALYFAAITGLGDWLSRLTESISQLQEARNFVKDYQEYMKLGKNSAPREKHSITQELRSEMQRQQPVGFQLRNVSYAYTETGEDGQEQTHQVLKNLDLEIAPGEKLAVVGVNGAGKTTLIKLLCGLLHPQQGEILVGGIPQTAFEPQEYYELFSAVFQSSGVLPVSVADNIALNITGSVDQERLRRCIRAAGLEEKIDSLPQGVDTCLVKRITEQGTELSGGQLQRLLLARALYKDAPVLVLDEPTAALDPLAEQEIYERYRQFTEGKTAVFISHRLASTRFCDRIILLEDGRIAESGTHEQLLARGGRYAEMFRVQSRYYQEEGEKI
ncbi:MAG: ABC transporter ATP-binding protein/permease [Acetatifactor sp.]|nr:ABC transporter ATP-binding protein/permease [Acetatifactor sp.]